MQPLNSPIEFGVRLVVILDAIYPVTLDIQDLTAYDYALVHSADLGGPPSLHPALPARYSELGIRRELVIHGAEVMIRAGLIECTFSDNGVQFGASEETHNFLAVLESPHVRDLSNRCLWLASEIESHGSDLSARLNSSPNGPVSSTDTRPA